MASNGRSEATPGRAQASADGSHGANDSEDDENGDGRAYEEDDDDLDDPFRSGFLGAGGPPGQLSNTLRALTGLVSGLSQRLRDILERLRNKSDPSIQVIALQELSEILLISTEDNLSGHFSPDQFVKELVTLMEPDDAFGTENPDMMLLACRCLANLMEALPQSTANVVYGGAVPVLVQKLLQIEYIDLAEQALSVSTQIQDVSLDPLTLRRPYRRSRMNFLLQLLGKEVLPHVLHTLISSPQVFRERRSLQQLTAAAIYPKIPFPG